MSTAPVVITAKPLAAVAVTPIVGAAAPAVTIVAITDAANSVFTFA